MSSPLAVNVWGDLHGGGSRAEQARRTVAALIEAGVGVEVVEQEHEQGVPDRLVTPHIDALRRGRAAVVELHLDEVRAFSELTRAHVHPVGRATYAIGVWGWDRPELGYDLVFPLHRVDEVWVGSTHVRDVFLRGGDDIPVHVVPPIIDGPAAPVHDRAHFGLWPSTTVFVHVLDARHGSYELAGLHALLDAYEQAFAPHERGSSTSLVLAVPGLADKPDLLEDLQSRAVALRARLLTAELTPDEISSLLGLADAYVSLHRVDTTGLHLLEAMRQGVPVVATAYGGHTDVATGSNSLQVGYGRGWVGATHHELDLPQRRRWPVGTAWVEPDVEQAAFWLRHLHALPAERARLGALGAQTVAEQLSRKAVGAVMVSRLEALQDELSTLAPREA